jgi:hypothetical protein
MSSPGNPYHNAQADSFMKTLEVEAVYLAGYATFGDGANRLPTFVEDVVRIMGKFYRAKQAQDPLAAKSRRGSGKADPRERNHKPW